MNGVMLTLDNKHINTNNTASNKILKLHTFYCYMWHRLHERPLLSKWLSIRTRNSLQRIEKRLFKLFPLQRPPWRDREWDRGTTISCMFGSGRLQIPMRIDNCSTSGGNISLGVQCAGRNRPHSHSSRWGKRSGSSGLEGGDYNYISNVCIW